MTTGTLDSFGRIGFAVAVLYIPVLITAIFLVCRHGFKRDAGWIFLVLFAIGKPVAIQFTVCDS